jgi:hypothetical protein
MNDTLNSAIQHDRSSHGVSDAHVIANDEEALDVATRLAAVFADDAAARDRNGELPIEQLRQFSVSGLGGITVPREYGGADVSFVTLARVFAILSEADPSLGQIPQNHFGFLNVIRTLGSASQKQRYFSGVLRGKRLGNRRPKQSCHDFASKVVNSRRFGASKSANPVKSMSCQKRSKVVTGQALRRCQ